MAVYVMNEIAGALYEELSEYAKRWLLESGWSTKTAFELWCSSQPVHFIRVDDGLLIITNWFHFLKAEVHPLLKNKRAFHNKERLLGYIRNCFSELEVQRLEFRIRGSPGIGLRRVLWSVGATKEGILRSSDAMVIDGNQRLIDVEMWSILAQEVGLEVPYGSVGL